MKIIELKKNNQLTQKETTKKAFSNLEKTLVALRELEIPLDSVEKINEKITVINSFQENNERKFRRKLLVQKSNIIHLLVKEHGLVPEKYYQNQWFAIGMSTFGIPLGLIFSSAIGNTAFLGFGLPLGMLIGSMIGKQKDEKAKKEGKQINLSFR
ncbi:hypothetical protein [Tenacibaculum jejuense]|uniref:Uncharacterized protein n=1 Tax=Tenacibaculum jejuense TaxID=584609 RepID=A0A238UGK7_9FLAO|nr:hypothetical protein [Tenacibaculum jejuense]SNR17668.1 conserved protein of unknown function [Tenacibaculum jejuense]